MFYSEKSDNSGWHDADNFRMRHRYTSERKVFSGGLIRNSRHHSRNEYLIFQSRASNDPFFLYHYSNRSASQNKSLTHFRTQYNQLANNQKKKRKKNVTV